MFGLFVPGTPRPQGSKKAFVSASTGRVIMLEVSTNLKAWRKQITATALEAKTFKFEDQPLRVHLVFFMPAPAKRRDYPTTRPDLDKLTRAVLDGLTDAGIYSDDSQVCALMVSKFYANEQQPTGVRIDIEPMNGPIHVPESVTKPLPK